MTTIAHKNLTTTQLHEPKGADAATDDYVMTVTSNASVWKKLTDVNLTGTGNPFGAQLYHVQQSDSTGTNGGSSSAATWNTRPLNAEIVTEITSASLSAFQVTLPAGTYFLKAEGEVFRAGANRMRFRNITDGSTAILGIADFCKGGDDSGSVATLSGRFTIAGSKVFELQHYTTNSQSSSGLGYAISDGENEIYADLKIWKIA